MSGSEHKRLIVAVLIGALGGAGTLRLWEWTWRRAELLDMDPSHGNLKKQMNETFRMGEGIVAAPWWRVF